MLEALIIKVVYPGAFFVVPVKTFLKSGCLRPIYIVQAGGCFEVLGDFWVYPIILY